MLFLKAIKRLLQSVRHRPSAPIEKLADDDALTRDINVTVTRIRLPSGGEVVIVKKVGSGE